MEQKPNRNEPIYLEDIYWEFANGCQNLFDSVGDKIAQIAPIKKYLKRRTDKYHSWRVRIFQVAYTFALNWEDERRFVRQHNINNFSHMNKLSNQKFKNLLDDYFKIKLNESKIRNVKSFICSGDTLSFYNDLESTRIKLSK